MKKKQMSLEDFKRIVIYFFGVGEKFIDWTENPYLPSFSAYVTTGKRSYHIYLSKHATLDWCANSFPSRGKLEAKHKSAGQALYALRKTLERTYE
jgi:hypothetical protein